MVQAEDGDLFLICDDGVLLRADYQGKNWEEVSKMPQPDKGKEKEKREAKKRGELICEIPLRDGKDYQVFEKFFKELKDDFPDVNVKSQLAKILKWNLDNPEKRKTRRGMPTHIRSWLKRDQAYVDQMRLVESVEREVAPVNETCEFCKSKKHCSDYSEMGTCSMFVRDGDVK